MKTGERHERVVKGNKEITGNSNQRKPGHEGRERCVVFVSNEHNTSDNDEDKA
jgi:hypothetical protein